MECLNSVKEQIYQDYEVIIIDDGSIDNTKDIIDPIIKEDERYIYYYQDNLGVSAARNIGIDKAKGQYIIFLDSDDKMNEMTLQECINCIKENSLLELVCFRYEDFDLNRSYKVRSKRKTDNLLEDYIKNKVRINTNCFFIKKECLNEEKIRFRTDLNNGEDVEFFVRTISKIKNYYFIDKILNYRRIDTENSLSTNNSFSHKVLKERLEAWRYIRIYLLENKFFYLAKVIEGYNIPGILIYGILNVNVNNCIIKKNLYIKYERDIKKIRILNGIRSIKQYIYLFKLNMLLKRSGNE